MAKRENRGAVVDHQTLQSILDILPGIVVLHAPDRSLRFVNRYFRELFGDPEARSCHEILHGRDEPCGECPPFRVFSTGSPLEREVTSPLGRTYQMHASPFTDSDGSPLVLELGVDVTDRKHGEVRLKSLKDCFLGFGADPIENINRLTALVGAFLEATCVFYNRLEGDLLHSLGRWNAPPDFNPVDRAVGHICHDVIRRASGDVLVLRNLQESPYAQTDPNVVPYGLKSYIGQGVEFGGKCVGSLCAVFQRDHVPSEGDKELMRAIGKAIGVEEERRRATDALRESEAKYKELVEELPQSVFEVDTREKLTFGNRCALDNFGLTQDDLRSGLEVLPFFVPEDRDRAGNNIRRILNGEKMGGAEYALLRKDGSKVPVIIYSSSIVRNNEPAGLRGVIVDITERKRVEKEKRRLERQLQQAQKMESLGVLAGGIAHDFNNLLMVVLGHAELALKEISPMSAARGSLTEISTAARRAADLCRQMLAYAGKASFALERVELRELVEEMAHLLKTAISKKAILNLNLDRDLPPIEADPSQIRQIALNLIINASEAIGDRSGVITVSVGATRCGEESLRRSELCDSLAPGLYVHLEVTDTGSGMDAETQSRIFEPFFSTKFTGRGLGLAAVLGIVRAHKGALKVYSEPGKGTTFKILFPALEAAGKGLAGVLKKPYTLATLRESVAGLMPKRPDGEG